PLVISSLSKLRNKALDLEVAVAVSGEFTSLHEALEVVGAEGFEGIGKALQILMNTAMHLERQKYLNASDYERTETRRGYANGYKPKTVKTRVGEVELRV